MAMRRKKSRPVDRAVEDLDRQIAAVERQLREAQQPVAAPATGRGPVGGMTGFMKQMLAPSRSQGAAVRSARTDLFDLGDETLKQLENDGAPTPAEPRVAMTPHYGEPLLAGGPSAAAEVPAEHDARLMRYLSAGTFRGQRPIKRLQRQQRNRFFMWIGLSFVALWLIYVVIR